MADVVDQLEGILGEVDSSVFSDQSQAISARVFAQDMIDQILFAFGGGGGIIPVIPTQDNKQISWYRGRGKAFAVGHGNSAPYIATRYGARTFEMKHHQARWGQTRFNEEIADFNLAQENALSHRKAVEDLLGLQLVHGYGGLADATPDQRIHSVGLEEWMTDDENVIDYTANSFGVGDANVLDILYGAAGSSYMTGRRPSIILGSASMGMAIERQIQITFGAPNNKAALLDFPGGKLIGFWIRNTFVPFFDCSFLETRAWDPVGSSARTATASANGALADDTWYYMVTGVTDKGESYVALGDEKSAATSGGNNSVTVGWAAWKTKDENNAAVTNKTEVHTYKIYRATDPSAIENFTLLDTIAGYSLDAAGVATAVTQYIDDGSITLPTGTAAVHPKVQWRQDLYIIDATVGTGSLELRQQKPMTPERLALTKDTNDWMLTERSCNQLYSREGLVKIHNLLLPSIFRVN